MDNVLTESDAKLYYKIFRPLLQYVNSTYQVVPEAGDLTVGSMDPNQCYQIAQKLWSSPGEIIDAYLAQAEGLTEEEKEILTGWKDAVTGRFYVERALKKGLVFIEEDAQDAYVVAGISNPLEESFFFRPYPFLVNASLIPWRDQIITDGLMQTYSIYFGGGIKRELKEDYTRIKATGHLYTDMNQKFHPEKVEKKAEPQTGAQVRTIYELKVYPKKYSTYTYRTWAVSDNTKLSTFTKKLLETWNLDESEECTYQVNQQNFDLRSKIGDLPVTEGQNFLLLYGKKWIFQIHVQGTTVNMCARMNRLTKWKGYSDCLEDLPGNV